MNIDSKIVSKRNNIQEFLKILPDISEFVPLQELRKRRQLPKIASKTNIVMGELMARVSSETK